MNIDDLELTARSIVSYGRGILAADETPETLTRLFAAHRIESTPLTRRAYRELFFTTPGVEEYIGGVILHDETIRQRSAGGTPLAALLAHRGIVPGIKIDAGSKPLAGCPGELITEGLDRLADRLHEYRAMGARFAKWRAVLVIDDRRPSAGALRANAHGLARYAAVCQAGGIVPIVQPEVWLEGSSCCGIERAEEVTGAVLHAVFDELFAQHVSLEGMLLKPNLVTAAASCATAARPERVALTTLRCLRRHVPPAVPGIAFLSGGQDSVAASRHLNLINQLADVKPWALTFSYGRALQDDALHTWRGREDNVPAAQRAFHHRARCAASAAAGLYSSTMELARSAA
jgi:fructose-bisphosphate aldolase class I